MSQNLDELINEYYNKFVGLPADNAIVRENQINDAFELVVLETLYGEQTKIKELSAKDVDKLRKYIVAPPDDGIDIVIEREDIDDTHFDFVQVKKAALSPLELKQALLYMENSVNQYLKKKNIGDNLKRVLSETSLDSSNKDNINYIVVHCGEENRIKNQEKNQQIITAVELMSIRDANALKCPRVPYEKFEADSFNNFSSYDQSVRAPAFVFNIRGYDLAKLARKYTNTSLGKNILFGQNLREALEKSKTYEGMKNTIRNNPEDFWFYNNGITILAEDFNSKCSENSVEQIILKNFSIINGAQTTSSLGKFLQEATLNECEEDIEKLKKVFVLVRVLKVVDEDFAAKIAIYNNTQNPITTRDMASGRPEQQKLYNKLLGDSEPKIYMEIRRGMKQPSNIRIQKHRITTNEELAQLAYAGFKRDPFTGKDKKTTLFDTDYHQSEFLLNQYYHKIFQDEGQQGILFSKNKFEIDELLFVYYLYKEAKKSYIREMKKHIDIAQNHLNEQNLSDEEKTRTQNKISNLESQKAICNVCAFYCLDYYYAYKENFPEITKNKTYDYDRFYSKDKAYQETIIKTFRDFFVAGTISVIKDLASGYMNLNTWVRDKKSTPVFNEKVDNTLQLDIITQESKYQECINALMVEQK